MDAESSLTEKVVDAPNNGSTPSEPANPVALKEKVADDLKSAATLKGGGDGGSTLDVPLEKDDLLERLDKIDTSSTDNAAKASGSNSVANDVDMENDDLIQRLEAMEKGEQDEQEVTATATTTASVSEKLEDVTTDASHQNGLEKSPQEAEALPEEDKEVKEGEQPTKKDEVSEGMEVDSEEKKDNVTSSDSTVVAESTPNGDSNNGATELPTSSAKRRHSDDEEMENCEPSSKKLHVEESVEPSSTEEATTVDVATAQEIKVDEQEQQKSEEQPSEKEPTDELEKANDLPVTDKEESSTADTTETEKVPEKHLVNEDAELPKPESVKEIASKEQKAEETNPSEDSAPPPEPDPTPEPISTTTEVNHPAESEPEKAQDDELDSNSEKEKLPAMEVDEETAEQSETSEEKQAESTKDNDAAVITEVSAEEPQTSDEKQDEPTKENETAAVDEISAEESQTDEEKRVEPQTSEEKLDAPETSQEEQHGPIKDNDVAVVSEITDAENTETKEAVETQEVPEEKTTPIEEKVEQEEKTTSIEEKLESVEKTPIEEKTEPEEKPTPMEEEIETKESSIPVPEAEQSEKSEHEEKSKEIEKEEHHLAGATLPDTQQENKDNEEQAKPEVQTVSEEKIAETKDETAGDSTVAPSDEQAKSVEEENTVDKQVQATPDKEIDSLEPKEKEPEKDDESTVEAKTTVNEQQAEPSGSSSQEKVEDVRDSVDTKVEEVSEEVQSEPATKEEEPAVSPPEPAHDVPESMQDDEMKPASSTEEAEPTAEALPDTEPNTESDSEMKDLPSSSSPDPKLKPDEGISSSSEPPKGEEVAPSSTMDAAVPEQQEQVQESVTESETVTSSDEKPTPSDSTAEIDSTLATNTAASEQTPDEAAEEPMEVDSESVEVAEASCTKQEAYVCTDEAKEQQPIEEQPQESEPATVIESTSAPVEEKEKEVKKAEENVEKMEVDSAEPTQSKPEADATIAVNTTADKLEESVSKDDVAIIADSQSESTASAHNKNLDATEGPANESKTLDDSIECSLPTSSSDKLADRLKQRLDMMSNGSSTPNAAVSSSNVFNSTPIQKQFEISSENVSKITRNSVDNSRQEEEEHSAIVVDNSIVDEKEGAVASTSGTAVTLKEGNSDTTETSEKSSSVAVKSESSTKTETEISEVDSCTASSAFNTADEINLYTSNARKFNGISSTSGSELEEKSKISPASISSTAAASTTVVNKLDLTPGLTSEEALYEVSVWFDGNDLQFMSVERMEHKLPATTTPSSTSKMTTSSQDLTTGIDSSNKSSNGSVSSIGPFSLPLAKPTTDSALSHSSTSSSGTTAQAKTQLPRIKQTVQGAKALASLMIEEFTKIKRTLCKDDDEPCDLEPVKSTPSKTPKSRPVSSSKKPAGARGQKRTHTDSEATEGDEPKPRAKQAKKSTKSAPEPTTPTSTQSSAEAESAAELAKQHEDAYCCLARWTDRKYYAGKVTGYKGDNKYMVLFEDGASKALSKDVIVFGEKDTLPIFGHSVHALTGGDTYEPGFVTEIKRNEANEVIYVVQIGEGSIEVTASDMYLNDEQAKAINKACKATTQDVADERNSSMHSPLSSGKRTGSASNTPILQTPDDKSTPTAEKGSRSTRSKRGADKPQTPVTPEAGYSGGVGKKGRRGRSKAQPAEISANTSEYSDASDTPEQNVPIPDSPESGLESVDGVQPELQKTEKESEIKRMYLVAKYLGKEHELDELLGPLPDCKTLFKNKHFLLTCTIPPKGTCLIPDKDKDVMKNKYVKFSTVPFIKEHLRKQIEAGGGKIYRHFEDIPKSKYKACKLIAPHPSATAKYVQCLAVDIPAVSHEWIIECCRTLTFLDAKPFLLPAGWSLIENRYIRWSCGRGVEQRSTLNPFVGYCVNIASMNKDFTDFWAKVCKMAGGTIRIIKSETDLTSNLNGYMLTDQEFPEEIKLTATRYGLQIVSTVWVVQSLIVGRICRPDSHEKLTQIYQDDDY